MAALALPVRHLARSGVVGGRPRGEASWAALGGKPYAHTASGWQEVDLPDHEDKVAAIAAPRRPIVGILISGEEVRAVTQPAAGDPSAAGRRAPLWIVPAACSELLCLDAPAWCGGWTPEPLPAYSR